MQKKKKGAGGKLSRSEIIQARLNPRVRFMSELIATHQRRTLSSLVESSLEEYANSAPIVVTIEGKEERFYFNELVEELWSPDEVVRFTNTAFVDVELLGIYGCSLWDFILCTPYFWAHYEIPIKDRKGNFIKKTWEPYHHKNGLLIENLKKYWDLIQTEEDREKVGIPDELGKKISIPVGVETEMIFAFDPAKPLLNRDIYMEQCEIWRQNIHRLIKTDTEVVDTPNGPRTLIKTIYPTPEEQMEMVERIYKEKNNVDQVQQNKSLKSA